MVPVSSSPIKGTSLASLVAQGTAWTISGADMVFHDPLQGLGLLVLSEVGLTVASVIRAHRETLAIAIKYRMRRRYGVPQDWLPPEDRRYRTCAGSEIATAADVRRCCRCHRASPG